jgi:hypothetical protein
LYHTAFDSHGNLLEIEFLKRCKHPNIVGYNDSGETVIENKKFFICLKFLLSAKL